MDFEQLVLGGKAAKGYLLWFLIPIFRRSASYDGFLTTTYAFFSNYKGLVKKTGLS